MGILRPLVDGIRITQLARCDTLTRSVFHTLSIGIVVVVVEVTCSSQPVFKVGALHCNLKLLVYHI